MSNKNLFLQIFSIFPALPFLKMESPKIIKQKLGGRFLGKLSWEDREYL